MKKHRSHRVGLKFSITFRPPGVRPSIGRPIYILIILSIVSNMFRAETQSPAAGVLQSIIPKWGITVCQMKK